MDRRERRRRDRLRRKVQNKIQRYASGLVKRATVPELRLKEALDNMDIDFQFQKIVYNHEKGFILDFYLRCDGCKLVVEVDGKNHDSQIEYDKKRTLWLKKNRNCTVIRFKNEDILTDIDSVIAKIMTYKPITNSERMTRRVMNMAWMNS